MESEKGLNSAVGRRKEGDEPRPPVRFTLRQSTIDALRAKEKETEVPMSRIVDRAVRQMLELDEPGSSDV